MTSTRKEKRSLWSFQQEQEHYAFMHLCTVDVEYINKRLSKHEIVYRLCGVVL